MRAFLLLLALVLLLPTVQAQAPTSAVTVEGVSQKYLATSSTQLVPVTVVLTINNVVCTASAALKVTMAATSTPASNATGNTTSNQSIQVTASPAELTFTIPQGVYGNNAGLPAARPYQGRQTSTIAAIAGNLSGPASFDLAYTAAFPGYTGTECRGNGAIGSAKFDGKIRIEFPSTAPAAASPTPELPLPPALALLALAGALVVMRRRAA